MERTNLTIENIKVIVGIFILSVFHWKAMCASHIQKLVWDSILLITELPSWCDEIPKYNLNTDKRSFQLKNGTYIQWLTVR